MTWLYRWPGHTNLKWQQTVVVVALSELSGIPGLTSKVGCMSPVRCEILYGLLSLPYIVLCHAVPAGVQLPAEPGPAAVAGWQALYSHHGAAVRAAGGAGGCKGVLVQGVGHRGLAWGGGKQGG